MDVGSSTSLVQTQLSGPDADSHLRVTRGLARETTRGIDDEQPGVGSPNLVEQIRWLYGSRVDGGDGRRQNGLMAEAAVGRKGGHKKESTAEAEVGRICYVQARWVATTVAITGEAPLSSREAALMGSRWACRVHGRRRTFSRGRGRQVAAPDSQADQPGACTNTARSAED